MKIDKEHNQLGCFGTFGSVYARQAYNGLHYAVAILFALELTKSLTDACHYIAKRK